MKKIIVLFSIALTLISCSPMQASQGQNGTTAVLTNTLASADTIMPTKTKTPFPTPSSTSVPAAIETAEIFPTPDINLTMINQAMDGYEWHGIEFDLDGQLVQIVTNLPPEKLQITDINFANFQANLKFLDVILNNGEPARIEIRDLDQEPEGHMNCLSFLGSQRLLCPSQGTNPYHLYISPANIASFLKSANTVSERTGQENQIHEFIAIELLFDFISPQETVTMSIYDTLHKTIHNGLKNRDININFIGIDLGDTPFKYVVNDSQNIFMDSLENGWQISADNGEVITDSSTNVYAGNYAIEVMLEENDGGAYEANIVFSHPSIDTSMYEWVEFQLFKPKEPINIYMSAGASNGDYLTEDPGAISITTSARGGFLADEKWQTVRMPLKYLGVEDDYLGKIWIRIFSGNDGIVLIDDVRLISSQ